MSEQSKSNEPTSWLAQTPAGFVRHDCGDGAVFLHQSVKIATPSFSIGRFSYINAKSQFGGAYPIQIGAFCSISFEVYAWTRETHDLDHATTSPLQTLLGFALDYSEIVEKPQGITIGNDVYIGHGVRIMPGVTIGDGAVVGARAVVTRDLEPYGIYGGVPARLIRKRFADPVIAALQQIKFWEWSLDKMLRNGDFFNLNLRELDDPAIIFQSIKD